MLSLVEEIVGLASKRQDDSNPTLVTMYHSLLRRCNGDVEAAKAYLLQFLSGTIPKILLEELEPRKAAEQVASAGALAMDQAEPSGALNAD